MSSISDPGVAFSSQPFWLIWAQTVNAAARPGLLRPAGRWHGVVIDVRPDDRIEPCAEAF
jgi:hypothetical protein